MSTTRYLVNNTNLAMSIKIDIPKIRDYSSSLDNLREIYKDRAIVIDLLNNLEVF